jgi:hypothetical protein
MQSSWSCFSKTKSIHAQERGDTYYVSVGRFGRLILAAAKVTTNCDPVHAQAQLQLALK